MESGKRPMWLPDTQGFLSIAIIVLMGGIVGILLLGEPPKFDDKTAGALMMVLGVLTACLKDVYSFFFGSSKGSEKKDEVISTIAATPPPAAPVVPPTVPGTTTTIVTTTPEIKATETTTTAVTPPTEGTKV